MTDPSTPCSPCSALHCDHCSDGACPCQAAGHEGMLAAESKALSDLTAAANRLTTAEQYVGRVRQKVSARV